MNWQCVQCGTPLRQSGDAADILICPACLWLYPTREAYLICFTDRLMFRTYGRRYLLNRVLNANAELAYRAIPERSLSLRDREDVSNFRHYVRIYKQLPYLDVGCGTLPLPGYLDTEAEDQYGLDPIDDNSFEGFRIVGHAEFTPFPNDSLGMVIFATSLDHVVSVPQVLKEMRRILRPGGFMVIWMSDRWKPWWRRLADWFQARAESWRKGYPVDRYGIYPDLKLVLYRPPGAVDTYHAFRESPTRLNRMIQKQGFVQKDMTYLDSKQVFLCYEKRPA